MSEARHIPLDEAAFRAAFELATPEVQRIANELLGLMTQPRPQVAWTDETPKGLTPGEKAANITLLVAAGTLLRLEMANMDLQVVVATCQERLADMVEHDKNIPDFTPTLRARQLVEFLAGPFTESSLAEVLNRVSRVQRAAAEAAQEDAQDAQRIIGVH